MHRLRIRGDRIVALRPHPRDFVGNDVDPNAAPCDLCEPGMGGLREISTAFAPDATHLQDVLATGEFKDSLELASRDGQRLLLPPCVLAEEQRKESHHSVPCLQTRRYCSRICGPTLDHACVQGRRTGGPCRRTRIALRSARGRSRSSCASRLSPLSNRGSPPLPARATTGQPAASASITTVGHPSNSDARTRASARRYRANSSEGATFPRNCTVQPSARARRRASSRPEPAIKRVASLRSGEFLIAWMIRSTRFSMDNRPAKSNNAGPSRLDGPSEGAAAANHASSIAFGMTTMRSDR